MNYVQNPTRQVGYLQQCLSSDKKPLGLFLGAGCPMAVRVGADGKSPIIPDIAGITKLVRDDLAKCKDCGPLLKIVEEHFKKDGRNDTTIEDMLTHIRALRAVAGKDEVRGLSAEKLDKLDAKICQLIHQVADKTLPNDETPYHRIATWVDAVRRDNPIEIFTTNYDLLMEQAFEDSRVPYFDGFAGVRKPFFDLRAMEEDMLPPRWARLWKLHGSVNWYQVADKGVFRGTTNEDSGSKRVIHPSHLKYQESRRMPYLAMIDRLRAFLKQPTATLILCGYSDPTGLEVTSGGFLLVQTSGPYWGVFIWWHFLYTGDVAYLREVGYPILREVAMFFTHYLRWHPGEERYHLEVSQNAELMYIKYDDPIDTLAFLKYTLRATMEAAKVLQCDEKLAEQCRHVLAHYPEYARHGLEMSPLRGLRPNHMNHMRTLAALFPCGEFDPEVVPEWKASCLFEIEKGDFWYRYYGCNQGRLGGWSGTAYHLGLPLCWLGMKEKAWVFLEELLKLNVKPNGLISHNWAVLADSRLSEWNIRKIPEREIYHDLDPDPLKSVELLTSRLGETTTENLDCRDTSAPALEGPAVYLLLMGEMLLQSHNGILRLFPGLPDDQDAEFCELRAEGATLVSSARKQRKVISLHLKALAAVEWKVKNPWRGKTVFIKSKRAKQVVTSRAEEYLELRLKRGESVVMADQKVNLSLEPRLHPRMGEAAQARCKVFADGMLVWLGKPRPSIYYASLEAARVGKGQAERYQMTEDG